MTRGQKRANAFRCKIHLNLKVQKVKSFFVFCFHGLITLLWLLLLLLAVLLQWPSPTFTLTLMLPHQLNAELDRASMFILCWWCHTEGAAHTMGQGQAGVSIVCQEFVNGLQKCDGQMLINVHKENSQQQQNQSALFIHQDCLQPTAIPQEPGKEKWVVERFAECLKNNTRMLTHFVLVVLSQRSPCLLGNLNTTQKTVNILRKNNYVGLFQQLSWTAI